MLRWLNKPEYVYRPAAIVRRFRRLRGPRRGRASTVLPWGLLDEGGTAYDAGANLGYTASVMAARVGPRGSVNAFEPHPDVWKELERNVAGWAGQGGGVVSPHRLALSDSVGTARLEVTGAFDRNRGTASLAGGPGGGGETVSHAVPTDTLDALVPNGGGIDLLKIDVEGHELAVLRGAAGLLRRGAIRDVVFEEHRAYPTDVTALLERHRYRVLRLRKSFRGLRLDPPDRPPPPSFDPINYLATLDPDRALARLRRGGWQSLGNPVGRRS